MDGKQPVARITSLLMVAIVIPTTLQKPTSRPSAVTFIPIY
jgi:hypothetical protein